MITVITPTLPERVDLLEQCLDSVKSQTVEVNHVILTDTGRIGPSMMRNTMMDLVGTEWVLFLDDDDLIDPDFVESCLPFLDDNDVVYTWCRKNFDYPLDLQFDGDELRRRNIIPVTALVRVSKFREVGGFGEGPYEDWKLWVKLLDAGARFYCTCERKWTYRRSNDGQWSKDAG